MSVLIRLLQTSSAHKISNPTLRYLKITPPLNLNKRLKSMSKFFALNLKIDYLYEPHIRF